MVKPAFRDVDVELWKSRVSLDPRYQSICLHHRQKQIGIPILEALCELDPVKRPDQRMLTLVACDKADVATSLRLVLCHESESLRVMNISLRDRTVQIEMTMHGVLIFKRALTRWFEGGEDFGVSPEDGPFNRKDLGRSDLESYDLWFWGPTYLP